MLRCKGLPNSTVIVEKVKLSSSETGILTVGMQGFEFHTPTIEILLLGYKHPLEHELNGYLCPNGTP